MLIEGFRGKVGNKTRFDMRMSKAGLRSEGGGGAGGKCEFYGEIYKGSRRE